MDFDGLRDFVLGKVMKDLVSNFLNDGVMLFNEQFVVKAANTGASFGWHQDGGYIPFEHDPYVTVWIALDDTTVENGAVFLLPRSPEDTATPVKHWWNEDGKEYVGYDGPDPGIPAEVSAGSIVIFSSLTLHRSSPNVTDRQRRGYVMRGQQWRGNGRRAAPGQYVDIRLAVRQRPDRKNKRGHGLKSLIIAKQRSRLCQARNSRPPA